MPTFRIKEAADLLGVSNDTFYRWIDAGRITAADDASGVLAVDGAALARLAQELAEPTGHRETKMVVAHSVRNRFSGLVSRVVRDTVMAQVEIQAGPHRFVSLLSREAVAHRPGPWLNRAQDQRYISGAGISSTGDSWGDEFSAGQPSVLSGGRDRPLSIGGAGGGGGGQRRPDRDWKGVPVSGVRVLVGTRKGAFVLNSDGKRQRWDVSGPHFAGWEIYHVKGSPADPDRLFASQSNGWFGQLIQRSDDGAKTGEPVGNTFRCGRGPGTHQW